MPLAVNPTKPYAENNALFHLDIVLRFSYHIAIARSNNFSFIEKKAECETWIVCSVPVQVV